MDLLRQLNLEHCAQSLRREEIDWETLQMITRQDLAAAVKTGPATKIYCALHGGPMPSPATDSADPIPNGWSGSNHLPQTHTAAGASPPLTPAPPPPHSIPTSSTAPAAPPIPAPSQPPDPRTATYSTRRPETEADVAALFERHTEEEMDYGALEQCADCQVVGLHHDPIPWPDWDIMHLPSFLLANILRCKYLQPTPVQRWAIPAIGETERDVMISSQTGSGKTAAYLIPIIAFIASRCTPRTAEPTNIPSPVAVVLAPTHELVEQIYFDALKLTYQSPIRISCQGLHGRAPPTPSDVDLVVSGPARLLNHRAAGRLSFEEVQFVVLDEVDAFLAYGEGDQLLTVLRESRCPRRRVFLVSATISRPVVEAVGAFIKHEIFVRIGKINTLPVNLGQEVLLVPEQDKPRLLREMLARFFTLLGAAAKGLVFVNKQERVQQLLTDLRPHHGDLVKGLVSTMTLEEREATIRAFRAGKVMVLIATDVAGRGLDIPELCFVINYDFPFTIDSYIHRVGRAARAGRRGIAASFYNDRAAHLKAYLLELLIQNGQSVPDFLQNDAPQGGADVYNANRTFSLEPRVRNGRGQGGGRPPPPAP